MQRENGKSLWQALLARMRADKRFEAVVYLILLLLAAAFCVVLGKIPLPGMADTQKNALERQLEEALCCMQGVGETRVMITKDAKQEEIRGVIVVAQGAEELAVKTCIQNAVCTVLDIEARQVEVYKMQKAEEE